MNLREKHTLVLGHKYGVPAWAARKLDLLFGASSILIDGLQYSRYKGDSIRKVTIYAGLPLYAYKLSVQLGDGTEIPIYDHYLLATEDGRLITTEDGKYLIEIG